MPTSSVSDTGMASLMSHSASWFHEQKPAFLPTRLAIYGFHEQKPTFLPMRLAFSAGREGGRVAGAGRKNAPGASRGVVKRGG